MKSMTNIEVIVLANVKFECSLLLIYFEHDNCGDKTQRRSKSQEQKYLPGSKSGNLFFASFVRLI